MKQTEKIETRIRGRSAECEDGKFYYEVSVWRKDASEKLGETLIGPFETREIAKEAGLVAVKGMLGDSGVDTVANMLTASVEKLGDVKND